MVMHYAGEIVVFTAERPAVLFGEPYEEGDIAIIKLSSDWDEEEGSGDGGPWGYGGYSSQLLETIGTVVSQRFNLPQ